MNNLELISILENLFPLKNGLSDDNNGCNFYFKTSDSVKCLIALDLTLDMIQFAIKNNVNFLILHHPIIYYKYNEEIKNVIKKQIFNLIEKHKITCYVIHTNYNISIIGINYKLLNLINAQSIKLINSNDVSYSGTLKIKKSFYEIALEINKVLNLNYNQYIGKMESIISSVAICSGAGNNSILYIDKTIDLFITGELKWSVALELSQKNINVLLLGHYMEYFFVDDIKNILKNQIKNIDIILYNQSNILNILTFIN